MTRYPSQKEATAQPIAAVSRTNSAGVVAMPR
jgi:hypothetical protein